MLTHAHIMGHRRQTNPHDKMSAGSRTGSDSRTDSGSRTHSGSRTDSGNRTDSDIAGRIQTV